MSSDSNPPPSSSPSSSSSSQAVAFRIINVTDVYKLDNFPSLKTLIEEKAAEARAKWGESTRVFSVLTGDFLAPYLLSSLDKGTGMVNMLNKTPVDYVIFGNHEDDIEHRFVCQRAQDYQGVWINTNMPAHEAFPHQQRYALETVRSPDGAHERTLGLVGVLSASPSLYREGAFNGAPIEDPWESLAEWKSKLEDEEGVDLVLPLCHLYVPQDKITCQRFDFPVILSGHDHHTVDEVYHGTRLLKAGADANQAVVLDIVWDSPLAPQPSIDAQHVTVSDWAPHEEMESAVRQAYSVLDKLAHTEVCKVPERFRPLESEGARHRLVNVAYFLFGELKAAMNRQDRPEDRPTVDAVIISGGNIRGGDTYEDHKAFSLKSLQGEIQEALTVCVVSMPGRLIAEGIPATHTEANPGFLQFDEGISLDEQGRPITVAGEPLQADKEYRVATTPWDLQDGPCQPWVEYYQAHPDQLPDADTELPVLATLMNHFARHVWKQVWDSIDTNQDGVIDADELALVDTDGDQRISKTEMAAVMKKLGWDVHPDEVSFVDCIMDIAGDVNHDGYLSAEELHAPTY